MDAARQEQADFDEAFRWALERVRLPEESVEPIKSAIWDIARDGMPTRQARKTLAPLLPDSMRWPGAGPYLLCVPTLKELMEDGMSRAEAQRERERAKRIAEEGDVLADNDRKHVAETLAHFVIMKMYAIGHWRHFQLVKDTFPYLRFDAVKDSLTPPDCLRRDGRVYRIDDPEVTAKPIPCGRAFCRCIWRAETKMRRS